MSSFNGIERRDPCKPILLLGTTLSAAKNTHASGKIVLQTHREQHHVQFADGKVSAVTGPWGPIDAERATDIFSLNRPVIRWENGASINSHSPLIDPAHLLVKGVAHRQELFDPISFVDRVPVETLQVDSSLLYELKKLPFSQNDIRFLKQLRLPTPIAMILWKRGLAPQQAASLLTALNLLGIWKNIWSPGDLPQLTAATKILRLHHRNADNFQLLGLQLGACAKDVDRAFRQLSFELHPDRLAHTSKDQKNAFAIISNAYNQLRQKRIQHSRRKRPVAATPDTSLWQRALNQAEAALQQGNAKLAKKHALNGLTLHPPPFAKSRFTRFLSIAA